MLPLAKNAIHVWLAYYDELIDEGMYIAYRSLLSSDEAMQQLRFHFERDRRRYLVTRALVRTVLSRYEPVSPRDWVFSANAYGRPQIENRETINAGLTFNISHTDNLIVLGVTKGRELGVDVENVRARQISIDIADRFFSPPEVAALALVPPDQQQGRFFEYWTLKESYIKARGLGLAIPLDKFGFHYPRERSVKIVIDPGLEDDVERWQFWQFRPMPEYVVAVCAERVDTDPPIVVVRKVTPMGVEKIIATSFTRTSGELP
jgi:4'-phosphopantetheinyl transferase